MHIFLIMTCRQGCQISSPTFTIPGFGELRVVYESSFRSYYAQCQNYFSQKKVRATHHYFPFGGETTENKSGSQRKHGDLGYSEGIIFKQSEPPDRAADLTRSSRKRSR